MTEFYWNIFLNKEHFIVVQKFLSCEDQEHYNEIYDSDNQQ
jgi:hypothetical protein